MAAVDPGPMVANEHVAPEKIGTAADEKSSSSSSNSSSTAAAAAAAATANDDEKGTVEVGERATAPDQFDERLETTRREIWSYYAYYIGANGLALFNFGPTAAQNLLSQASHTRPGSGDTQYIYWAGSDKTINSVILQANGISFAIQVVIFLILGSYADFGTWRPSILIVLSICAYAIGFAWLGVHEPSAWHAGLGLYIVGLIMYQLTLTYWTAAFPGLARNTRYLREAAVEYEAGDISREEYDKRDSLKRSELASVSFYVQSVGELVILAVIVGILFGLNVRASTANNNWGLSVLIAFASGVWLLLSVPWFLLEKRRPGLEVNGSIVLAGFKQLARAGRAMWQLKMSLFYLIGERPRARRVVGCEKDADGKLGKGYFLLGDSLNTTVTVIATLQNAIVFYDTLELTYLFLVGIAAQAVGIYAFWFIQRKFQLTTKTMFGAVMVGIILLDGWGMVGIWTQSFGFHHVWEVWVYQTFYGLFVCPWYAYSQIMISEVTPRGYEFLFFSLYSIIGKTSSFIGPLVSSAIIDASPTGNNSLPFYFLFGLSLASAAFIWVFVDLGKSRAEQERFLAREAERAKSQ